MVKKNNLKKEIMNLMEEYLWVVGLGLLIAGLIAINPNPSKLVFIGIILCIIAMPLRARRLTR